MIPQGLRDEIARVINEDGCNPLLYCQELADKILKLPTIQDALEALDRELGKKLGHSTGDRV